MKYIKLYESFNTQDIKDILLEVEDLGYGTKIILLEDETGNYGDHEGIMIIAPSRGSIKYIEIEDCLLRLKDYLGDNYIGCKIMYYDNNNKARYELFNLTEECDLKSPVGIIIDYRK